MATARERFAGRKRERERERERETSFEARQAQRVIPHAGRCPSHRSLSSTHRAADSVVSGVPPTMSMGTLPTKALNN